MAASLPVMLADSCTSGNDPDVYQIKVPEAPQPCIPRDGDVKGTAQLDGAVHSSRGGEFVGGVDGVGDVACTADLPGEEMEELIRLRIDAAGELKLFHHLVGAVIELLFGRDDTKQIDDEGQQQDSDEDEYHRTEIIGLAPLVF